MSAQGRLERSLDDVAAGDDGSSPAEFVLVGALLTVVVLAIVQFAIVVYVRNVVHDAAVEGAYTAALADHDPVTAESRTRELIARALGEDLNAVVIVREEASASGPVVRLEVVVRLPLAGLLGIPNGLEVIAHAPRESFDRR